MSSKLISASREAFRDFRSWLRVRLVSRLLRSELPFMRRTGLARFKALSSSERRKVLSGFESRLFVSPLVDLFLDSTQDLDARSEALASCARLMLNTYRSYGNAAGELLAMAGEEPSLFGAWDLLDWTHRVEIARYASGKVPDSLFCRMLKRMCYSMCDSASSGEVPPIEAVGFVASMLWERKDLFSFLPEDGGFFEFSSFVASLVATYDFQGVRTLRKFVSAYHRSSDVRNKLSESLGLDEIAEVISRTPFQNTRNLLSFRLSREIESLKKRIVSALNAGDSDSVASLVRTCMSVKSALGDCDQFPGKGEVSHDLNVVEIACRINGLR